MIQIKDLSKSYSKQNNIDVLKNINFTINDGEVTALLGHNGSGKSTLIKCMVGVLKPTSGIASIDKLNSFKDRKKLVPQMGVIFNQKPSFIVDLNVYDNLRFFKAIYNISENKFNEMLDLINSYLDIKDLYERPYRKLSFGERVKCEIASILLHSPKYIFLDEPTIGLDYIAKEKLYKLLEYFNVEKKSTTIITTHEVDYIEKICHRVIILSQGQVKYDGTPKKIYGSLGHTVSLTIKYDNILDHTKARSIFDEANTIDFENGIITHAFFHVEDKNEFIKKVVEAFSVVSINSKSASLREVFEDVLKEVTRAE